MAIVRVVRGNRGCGLVVAAVFSVFTLLARFTEGASSGNVVACDVSSTSHTYPVTVTPSLPSFQITCSPGGATAIPSTFAADQKVCTGTVAAACSTSQALKELIPSAQPGWWVSKNFPTSAIQFTIPSGSFPRYTPAPFFLGCTKSSKNCLVTVAVQPTPAQYNQATQTVTCAYDQNNTFQVTLSPSSNKFTLNCGPNAVVQPTAIQTSYCPQGITATGCSGGAAAQPYKTIFHSYPSSGGWWTGEVDSDQGGVFTVPSSAFSSTSSSFFVGCAGPERSVAAHNVCSVQVTVAAITPTATESSAKGVSVGWREWVLIATAVVGGRSLSV
ncbi:SRS domain-containing protein [Neospora caninum Liverpool]|uniref:SRS domain-containing protein n=1 Tax=Neospora caninum (strain Liverpool) TaxID=572307 RepID=F0VJ45_NEOCL|nr:SRS domain-containing protein [Neospora caninum Liverpool]CBZ53756.1 SRS domain-containing protein [Neospora caninum Liverpool]CEL67748.1 TPA: SRS domain-containing protein [Neospora caninum Liverpool]|eukprot:XP_003883788.1 SRS domain-containing protein [Neospora caninum Liverpool]